MTEPIRAIQVPRRGDATVLEPARVPAPTTGRGEVRIDVTAAGVNFADVAKRRGTYPGGPEPPYVPGIEAAGRVAEAGDGTPFEPGDRVMAYARDPEEGAYAESVVVSASRAFPVPDGIDLTGAAAVPIQWVTAHNVLFEWGALDGDERVLVLAGAGGVGSAAVQLAATTGATVIATASTAEKRRFATDLGADHAIGYDDLAERIDAVTDGAGVDLVLDGVGGSAFDEAFAALAPGGRIVTYGLASGEVPRVSTPRLLFGNHSVIGYHLGHAAEHQPERVFGALDAIDRHLADGAVSVSVDRTFALEAAAAAHAYLEDRRTRGKVLLEP